MKLRWTIVALILASGSLPRAYSASGPSAEVATLNESTNTPDFTSAPVLKNSPISRDPNEDSLFDPWNSTYKEKHEGLLSDTSIEINLTRKKATDANPPTLATPAPYATPAATAAPRSPVALKPASSQAPPSAPAALPNSLSPDTSPPPRTPPVSQAIGQSSFNQVAVPAAPQSSPNLAQSKGDIQPSAEIAIILVNDRFYPSHIRLKEGTPARIIFTTTNKKPAALVIEQLKLQRWIASQQQPDNLTTNMDRAKWEVTREITSNRITEILWEPKRGSYSFHDALTGAMGEIVVE